jgi:hypothetical protein
MLHGLRRPRAAPVLAATLPRETIRLADRSEEAPSASPAPRLVLVPLSLAFTLNALLGVALEIKFRELGHGSAHLNGYWGHLPKASTAQWVVRDGSKDLTVKQLPQSGGCHLCRGTLEFCPKPGR